MELMVYSQRATHYLRQRRCAGLAASQANGRRTTSSGGSVGGGGSVPPLHVQQQRPQLHAKVRVQVLRLRLQRTTKHDGDGC
jgi:hypothetical protein